MLNNETMDENMQDQNQEKPVKQPDDIGGIYEIGRAHV